MNSIWRENFISSTVSRYPQIHFWAPVFLGWFCVCNSCDKGAKLAHRFWKNKKKRDHIDQFLKPNICLAQSLFCYFMTYYGKIIFDTWPLSPAVFFCAHHFRVKIIPTNFTHRRKSATNMDSGIHIKNHFQSQKNVQ